MHVHKTCPIHPLTMTHIKSILTSIFASISLLLIAPVHSAAADFFDTRPADKFLEIGIHGLAGTSTLLQNYQSCYPAITDIDMSAGFAGGVGGSVTFGLRNYLALSTELNFMARNSSTSMAFRGTDEIPTSAIYLSNHSYSFEVPVYVSVRFNLADNVRWNLQGGFYYSLGLTGTQHQTLMSSYINELGQMVNIYEKVDADYYNDPDAFINSQYRSDWGLMVGTSIDVWKHVTVGFRTMFGLKNVANDSDSGTIHPRVRNLAALGTVGWRF